MGSAVLSIGGKHTTYISSCALSFYCLCFQFSLELVPVNLHDLTLIAALS